MPNFQITESAGNIIRGIALVPRHSLNGNFYHPSELERAHGVRVPLDWEHDTSNVIGEAVFHYDKHSQQLRYEATITNSEKLAEIKSLIKQGKMFTSIEANSSHDETYCHSQNQCMSIPHNLEFVGLALTTTPGVPETSVVNEKVLNKPLYIPSQSCNCMSKVKSEKTKQEDTPAAGTTQIQDVPEVPADGKKIVNGEEVTKDNTTTTQENEQNKDTDTNTTQQAKDNDTDSKPDGKVKENDDEEDPKDKKDGMEKPKTEHSVGSASFSAADIVKQVIEAQNAIKAQEAKAKKTFGEKINSIPTVGNLNDVAVLESTTVAMINALNTTGHYNVGVDMGQNSYIKEAFPSQTRINEARRTGKTLKEAISWDGADNANKLNATTRMLIEPSEFYTKSIRDYVRYHLFPQGSDELKFTRMVPPPHVAVTEGTTNAAGTHSPTAVALQAQATRGLVQSIKQSDLEDNPQDVFGAIAEAARIAAIDHEAHLVFNTAANAVAVTGTSRAGWINGTSGADISEDGVSSVGRLTHQAFASALAYYEDQGYDTTYGQIKCALDPVALRQLRTDTQIQRYIQDGSKGNDGKVTITQSGGFSHLYGIEIIPTNKVFSQTTGTNPSTRSIFFVPQHSFVLGVKRDLEINIQKKPEKFAFDWSYSFRKNAIVFSPKSIVRCSSSIANVDAS